VIILSGGFNNKKRGITVSVVVATKDRSSYLRDLLKSLLYQEFKNFELIIVDDSENDYHRRMNHAYVRSISSRLKVRLIRNERNIGIPRSLNKGVSVAKGSIVAFTDDDCIAHPSWLSNLVKWYRYRSIGGVGGKVIPIEMDAIWSVKELKEDVDIGRVSWNGDVISNFDLGKGPIIVDCLSGANMSFKREVILEVGGFSPIYKGNSYRFESELSYRIRKLGYKIVYDPEAVILHRRALKGGARIDVYMWNYWLARNHTLFMLRNLDVKFLKLLIFFFKQVSRVARGKRACPYAEPDNWLRVLLMITKGIVDGIKNHVSFRGEELYRLNASPLSTEVIEAELFEDIRAGKAH